MKKILLLSLVILAIHSGMARGQAALLVLIFGEKAASENFYFSLKVGANYSIINGYDEGKNRLGANFGLINNIRINDRFYLTPEFLPLSSRGISDVPILSTGNPDLDSLLIDPSYHDRKLSYLDIPVLVRMNLGKRWSISAGPQFSLLTKAVDTYKSSPINDVILTTELDIKDAIVSVDVAAVIDLSLMLAAPKNGKGVNLYVRFTQGFIDILKENEGDRYTHSVIQFGASFPFIGTPEKD
jgi:hypothetical protein